MRVTPAELESMIVRNEAHKKGLDEHPVWGLSDDLFDRILADLQRLRAIEVGQGELL
jgi:hypothetical protein